MDDLLISLTELSIKGGEGSGFHAPEHAGRPGEVGGSRHLGVGAGIDNLPITATANKLTEKQFEEYTPKVVERAAMYSDDWKTSAARPNEITQRRLNAIEGLNQDELEEMFNLLSRYDFREVNYALHWASENRDLITSYAYDDIVKYQNELKEWGYNAPGWQALGIVLTRLDEAHTNNILQLSKKGLENVDENIREMCRERLRTIANVGTSYKLRRQAKELTDKTFMGSPELRSEIDKLVYGWCYASGTLQSLWLQAVANKKFNGKNETLVYWNGSSNGLILKDVDPVTLDAVNWIYNKTQDFYANKKVAKTGFTKLYRGVGREVTVSSPIESWTLNISTAKRFADMMAPPITKRGQTQSTGFVLENDKPIPIEKVLMTWESMKGIYPPESELRGKKEVVVIS